MFSWFKKSRRQKLLADPFPKEWLAVLQKNVGHYDLLPQVLQGKLRDRVRILMSERKFVGVAGLQVTDEMKLTVLGLASLLILGVEDYYFDKVGVIYLYPRSIRSRLTEYQSRLAGQGTGLVDEDALNLGEAWHDRRIRLSWPSVLRGARDGQDGHNLVLHEFAHHLDGLDGYMEGSPPQETAERHARWQKVMGREYQQLCDDVEAGRETLLDAYGTENEAEFFAVATEAFYEVPVELRAQHPELYGVMRDFYLLDPASWLETPA